jgi:hypothetical protein
LLAPCQRNIGSGVEVKPVNKTLHKRLRRLRMRLQLYSEKLLTSLCCVFLIIVLSSCKTLTAGIQVGGPPVVVKEHRGGPPPHAKAHGYRAKHTYRYYTCARVYFDLHRKVYFYLEGDIWRMSVSLPSEVRVQLGEYVTIEMDSDKPYTRFKEHKRKYPPGQLKKKSKWTKRF